MASKGSLWVFVVLVGLSMQWISTTQAAPVGAIDAKGITFKKLALEVAEGGSSGEGKSVGEKMNLPLVAAASISGGGSKKNVKSIMENPEDGLDDVMDGHQIFVTLPTTTTTSTKESILSTHSLSANTVEATEGESTPTSIASTSTVEAQQAEEVETLKAPENADPLESSSSNTTEADLLPSATAEDSAAPAAKIIQVSTNSVESEDGNFSMVGVSIEDAEKKIDSQNIQNQVLQEEGVLAPADLNLASGNRSRKSKGLIDSPASKNHLTRSTAAEENGEPSNPEARLQAPINANRNFQIQFSDNDRLELLSSQNNALTSDGVEQEGRLRSSNVGLISGISFSVLALFCAVSLVGAMMYRRRYINKPQTLSEPDSSGYIDDSIIRVSG